MPSLNSYISNFGNDNSASVKGNNNSNIRNNFNSIDFKSNGENKKKTTITRIRIANVVILK